MTFFLITIGIIVAILGVAIFTQFSLSDQQYDRLKWIVIRWDYLIVFLGLVVKTFNVSYGLETVTIVGGIGALLAGLLHISNQTYEEHQKILEHKDTDENQMLMMENMFEEDELEMIKGE